MENWSVEHSSTLPPRILALPDRIIGISFDSRNPDIILFYSHTYIIHINLGNNKWNLITKFYPMIFCDYLKGLNQLFVMEQDWTEVVKQLPAPVDVRRYVDRGRGSIGN